MLYRFSRCFHSNVTIAVPTEDPPWSDDVVPNALGPDMSHVIYPLVIEEFAMGNGPSWPIEIDGLPFLIAWW